jgi:hypothetical protein
MASSPGWVQGYVPTANEWNAAFAAKLDVATVVTSFNTRTGPITLGPTDVTTALAFTPYDAANPAGYVTGADAAATYLTITNATATYLTQAAAAATYLPATSVLPSLQGFLGGLNVAQNIATPLTSLDIAAGGATDSFNASVIILPFGLTKSIAATWAAGTAAGGMGTGLTVAASTWYHVYLATIGGNTDVFFDTTFGPTHAPVGTTAVRRIRSFKTDGASHIIPDAQNGDRIDWLTPISEFVGIPGVTTAIVQTLSAVPTGVSVAAILYSEGSDGTPAAGTSYLSSLAQTDVPSGFPAATVHWTASVLNLSTGVATIMTNSGANIRRRVSTTTATVSIATLGYIDTRGRG